jgi:drug/metabolite transporter (DMT)-like permease
VISLSAPALGAVWIAISCVVSAAAEVFLGHVVQGLDPIAVNTATLGGTTALFLAYELVRDPRGLWALVRRGRTELILTNVGALISTVGFMLSLRWLEPSSTKAIFSSVAPLLTLGMGGFFLSGKRVSSAQRWGAAGTAFSALLLAYGVLSGNSGVGSIAERGAWAGLAAATAGGFGFALNSIGMSRYNDAGWTISQSMAVRYWLAIAVGIALWPEAGAPGQSDLGGLAFAVVIWVIIPVYLYQLGLRGAGALTGTLIVAVSPLMTWVFQPFDPRLSFSPLTAFALVLNASAAVWASYGATRRALA